MLNIKLAIINRLSYLFTNFTDDIILKFLKEIDLYTVHSKCINNHTLRSDIFLPKCPTNLRVNTL